MEKLAQAENIAVQRLRKTFKYPSESDDEDAVEAGMDEQDRTALLQTLSTQDTSATHTYTLLILTLPLLPTLLYLSRLLSPSTILPSLIAIASLLASAYTLYFLPLPPTEMEPIEGVPLPQPTTKGKKKMGGYGLNTTTTNTKTPSWEKPSEKSVRRPVPYLSTQIADIIGNNIVMVNRAVCGLLALYEVWLARDWSEGFKVGGGFLPGVICLVILWARTELRIIDMNALEKINAQGKKA